MYRRVSHFLFPDPIAWAALVLVAAGLGLWSYFSNFAIYYGGDIVLFYLIGASFVMGLIYQKRSPAIATFAFLFSFVMLMMLALRPLSYLAVAEQFPLMDAKLAEIDKLLGFDWLAHVAWVNEKPWLVQMLYGAYESLVPQMVFTFAVLYATLNYERLREFFMVFFGMAIVTSLLVTFFPAAGASYIYQPSADIISNMQSSPGSYSLEHFLALHTGKLHEITITKSVGLVTFPSFHTQTALLHIWIMRRTIMFWPFFILNTLMIISTIAIGGHYVIDLFAGALVTATVIYAYGVWSGRYRLALRNIRVAKIADATGFRPTFPILTSLQQHFTRKNAQEAA